MVSKSQSLTQSYHRKYIKWIITGLEMKIIMTRFDRKEIHTKYGNGKLMNWKYGVD